MATLNITDERERKPTEESATQLPAREIHFEHSTDLAELISSAQISVMISTYQAGKVAVLGVRNDELALSLHNFDRPMGVAVSPTGDRVAVASRDRVWMLLNVRDVAGQIEPPGQHDACLLARSARITGEIQAHELSWGRADLWIVNTLFSCLCTPDERYHFIPRWRPSFISELAPEDRCHLNGLAMVAGEPKFVTAMAETDRAGQWRENKVRTGCLIDVASSETVARGFAMPHSPRVHQGKIWLLDSGRGTLVCIDPNNGHADVVARFPGYVRGLAFHDHLALIGLSRIRETSTFGGVPIAEDRDRLKCGLAVVDLRTGNLAGQFEFKSGVEEIFDVSILPRTRFAALRGPFAHDDGHPTIWVVPDATEEAGRDGAPVAPHRNQA